MIVDLGKGSINAVSQECNCSWKYAKNCLELFQNKEKANEIEKEERRGRKAITETYPEIEKDIEKKVEEYASTDPDFKTEKRYIRLTIQEVRKELIKLGKYTEEKCPKKSTLGNLFSMKTFSKFLLKKHSP